MVAGRRIERLARTPTLCIAAVAMGLPLFFDPFASAPFEAAKVDFLRLAALVTMGWFLAAHGFGALEGKRRLLDARPLLVPVLLFGMVQLAATVGSLDPARSLWGGSTKHGTVTWLALFVFYFVVSRLACSQEARALVVRALVVGTVPVSLYGLAQFFGVDPLSWETDSISPMVSTLGRSNFVGAYLAIVVPFTLAWHRGAQDATETLKRWAPRGLLSMQYLSIFLTQARAAWIAALAATALFLYLSRTREARRRLYRPVIAIAVCGLVLLAAMSVLNLAALRGSDEAASPPSVVRDRANTATSRVAIWSDTLALSRAHWLLGHGPETFPLVFDSTALVPGGELVVEHPHNIVLDQLFSAGLLGVLSFSYLVARFYLSWPLLEQERLFGAAIMGSVTAFLVQAQFNPDVVVSSFLLWLNLGLAEAEAGRESRD